MFLHKSIFGKDAKMNAYGLQRVVRILLLGMAGAMLCLAACATVGRDFPVSRVSDIVIGETTQVQIESMFGSPWRVGIEDGLETWTYGKYRYRLFGETSTQDLVIRFNENDIVSSYTFNTTEHDK